MTAPLPPHTGRVALSTAEIQDRLWAVISHPARDLVRAYYTLPEFAGGLFDSFGENDPCRFTESDVVAASLLDVSYGPQAVRALLEQGTANERLAACPGVDDVLWDTAIDLSENSPAWDLWRHLTLIPNLGPTRVSKLLARKRPALFPILDEVIRERLGLGWKDAWQALRHALSDDQIREHIDALRESAAPHSPTTLRLLDVATWMRFSESKNARAARLELGLPILPRPGTPTHIAVGETVD